MFFMNKSCRKKSYNIELLLDTRLIKINVEGFEYECLKGLLNFILNVKPIIIVETLYNKA